MTTELVTTQLDKFFCDCKPECVDSFKLPTLVGEMLLNNTSLMLLIGKHTSDRAGDVVKKGKGWKVCKVK